MDMQNISIKNNSRAGEVAQVVEGLPSAKPQIRTPVLPKKKKVKIRRHFFKVTIL
jgi:DNA/RNA endonuclease G (NUC1)